MFSIENKDILLQEKEHTVTVCSKKDVMSAIFFLSEGL